MESRDGFSFDFKFECCLCLWTLFLNWFKPLKCLCTHPLHDYEVALSHCHVYCDTSWHMFSFPYTKAWKNPEFNCNTNDRESFLTQRTFTQSPCFSAVKWHRTLNHLPSTIITNWLHLLWWTRWSQRFHPTAWRTRLTITQAESERKSCPFSQIGG